MYEATTLSKLIEFLGIIFIAVVSAINLTLGRTRKVIRPPWWKGSGGGGVMDPFLVFFICCSISKRVCLQWKAFDLLYKMRYILWVMALLGVCDVQIFD